MRERSISTSAYPKTSRRRSRRAAPSRWTARSLTVAEVRGLVFTVSIVPYTVKETILGDYRPRTTRPSGDRRSGKYVVRALSAEEGRRGLAAWLAETEKTP